MEKILIVEDNPSMLEMLNNIISEKGYITGTAPDVSTALLLLKKENYDLIISDLQLPDMDGLTFFKKIKNFGIPFIILTAFGSIELAVESIKAGAFDFVSKPVDPDYLFIVIEKAIESTRILRENIILKSVLRRESDKYTIIGKSKALSDSIEKLQQVSPTGTPVLLLGESGTGKELFARAIHDLSPRKHNPFIAINSASIPETLLENELFGHEKGSFTDAHLRHTGKLELSQGGTFFLDEIGDLPASLQGKLLRVIEEKKVTRLGSNKEISLDIRFIFATNVDLDEAVKNGEFRKDLYYRLSIFPVHIPPLRERKGDIPLLAEYFVKRFSREMRKGDIMISENALKKLDKYSWPGNVRELQNAIERGLITLKGNTLDTEDIILPKEDPSLPDRIPGSSGLKNLSSNIVSGLEKKRIEETLDETGFNRKKTAEALKISYRTLLYKMKKYGIRSEN
ncbi:MAG: sigma-54-dependent Fis family transcriptional regulator [Candidatus Aminicenantes bacterium]|nr:sigma-54-dependent Fis family transcriptional regulator [Candidatus Aminicenantes bacterium]